MKQTRNMKSTRLFAGLLTALLFATLTVALGAQPAPDSRTARGFGPAYDAAHETTFDGTIQEVVTKHMAGSPAGIHLLVAGSQGVVDTHVGPFLSKGTKAALQVGMPVRIVGAVTTERGKSYLLVRQLTVGGHTINVRNEHGALARAFATHAHYTNKKTSKLASNGGAR